MIGALYLPAKHFRKGLITPCNQALRLISLL